MSEIQLLQQRFTAEIQLQKEGSPSLYPSVILKYANHPLINDDIEEIYMDDSIRKS